MLATDTAAEAEAYCRRLMARRAALPLTWETRAERERLAREIDVLLTAWCDAMTDGS